MTATLWQGSMLYVLEYTQMQWMGSTAGKCTLHLCRRARGPQMTALTSSGHLPAPALCGSDGSDGRVGHALLPLLSAQLKADPMDRSVLWRSIQLLWYKHLAPLLCCARRSGPAVWNGPPARQTHYPLAYRQLMSSCSCTQAAGSCTRAADVRPLTIS